MNQGESVPVDVDERTGGGLPTVPVHDLVIHPRDGDLVAATHGRSIWIFDDTGPLQQLTDLVRAADLHLFTSRPATRWRNSSTFRPSFVVTIVMPFFLSSTIRSRTSAASSRSSRRSSRSASSCTQRS